MNYSLHSLEGAAPAARRSPARRRGARRRGDPREAPEGRGAHRPRPARVPRREPCVVLRRCPLGGSIGREERLVLGCIEAKFCK